MLRVITHHKKHNRNHHTMLKVILFFFLTFTLYANSTLNQADTLFEQKRYAEAYVAYKDLAQRKENSKAAYKLAWMYQEGKGVTKDFETSKAWYQKAAKWDATDRDRAKAVESFYSSFDPLTGDSAESMMQYMSGNFAVRAFHSNYFVISKLSNAPQGDVIQLNNPYIKTETKMQISLRGDYTTNWFGGAQVWSGAYTQRSYWQLFIESEPFRETNYMPEAFVTLPFFHKLDAIAMKGMALGFIHQSNGQVEYFDDNNTFEDPSRSWNRLYVKGFFQFDKLFATLMLWYPILSPATINDNADIVDHYGYGSLELNYPVGDLLTRFNGRYNIETNKGSAELEFTYPMTSNKKIFYYLQGFTGYGQSLIDYHEYLNQVGFGISLSR